jgi:hypothetical protein
MNAKQDNFTKELRTHLHNTRIHVLQPLKTSIIKGFLQKQNSQKTHHQTIYPKACQV